MTPRGFEPLLPPWKGGVLTAWPWSLASSPSRARTYNNSVNSRVLYHWAIEEYLLNYRCQLFLSATFNILSHFHRFVNNFFNFFFACTFKTAHKLFIQTYYHFLPWPFGQALDRLVAVSSMPYGTSTPALSTSSSSRGLTLTMGYLILRGASRLDAFS